MNLKCALVQIRTPKFEKNVRHCFFRHLLGDLSGEEIDTKIARGGAPCAEHNERNASRACARDSRGVSALNSDARTQGSAESDLPLGMSNSRVK